MSGAPVVRLGVALPVFEPSASPALEAAEEAEAAGLDGVFCYDHLWPLGNPTMPARALFPLLGALAARTERLLIGPLVARIGIMEPEHLVTSLLAVEALSGGRLIAGLGTGDAKNAPENAAYGVAFAPAGERRAQLEEVATRLVAAGVTTWVGGGAPATNAIALRLGCPLNFWAAAPDDLAAHARLGPVTWAGNLPGDRAEAAARLSGVALAGAGWIIVHWPGRAGRLVEAAAAAGLARAAPPPGA
ncbi:MAG TPA: LLM class flavin-dependent oxidoreductase [Acidimicrobiales bacterium]|nr:LLM class flavin-dependent oxidoreductase [Acidimicrobiales bacterium]